MKFPISTLTARYFCVIIILCATLSSRVQCNKVSAKWNSMKKDFKGYDLLVGMSGVDAAMRRFNDDDGTI